MNRIHWIARAALALALLATAGVAKDAEEKDRPDDRAAIEKRVGAFLGAIGKQDAKAVAAFWTDKGEYARGEDLTIRGRETIEKAYATHLKKEAPSVVVESAEVRFLSDTTAIGEGKFRVKAKNPADDRHSHFSMLLVKEKGEWHFALLREWSSGPSLAELEWLVGAWGYKTDAGEATMKFEWAQKKRYLVSQFAMKGKDAEVTGFQVLAVDPETKGIRSWSFEGDGSIGSAAWVRTDKHWLAKTTAVNGDGEKTTGVVTLTPLGADTFEWKVTDRVSEDEKLPDLGPFEVSRKK